MADKKPKVSKRAKEELKNIKSSEFSLVEQEGFDVEAFEKKNFGKTKKIGEEEIQKLFTEAQSRDENPAKELFEVKGDVRTRTELSRRNVGDIVRLKTLSKELGFTELNDIADEFMYLMISHDRKSRKEFVETTKNNLENQQGANFFNRVGNMFRPS